MSEIIDFLFGGLSETGEYGRHILILTMAIFSLSIVALWIAHVKR